MNFHKDQKSKFYRLALAIVPALAITGFLAFATSNSHSWDDGLVGYWSFDGQYTTSTDGTADVSGITPTADQWHHLVGTYNHSYIRFYIDGI